MTSSSSYLELANRVGELLAPSLAEDWPRLPAVSAEGAYLYTADGRRYLDFTSGIAVTNLGHNHPRVLAAAIEQMKRFSHSAVGVTLHEPVLRLAETLPQFMPPGMNMFFFGNSGAEAIEGAIKLARYVTGRPVIISFYGGFHGRTYGAASVTSIKAKYRLHYEPLVSGIHFAEYPYPFRCPLGSDPQAVVRHSLDSLQRIFDHLAAPSEVAAILVEPIQGEGGYIVPHKDFFIALRQICDQFGILLILDEIQTGFGRSGEMFAAQAFSVRPDIMAIAKGIANGFPLGATVANRELMSRWAAGSHGTTYGGNPVSCAAALATLEVIREENVLDNCRQIGAHLLQGLKEFERKYAFIGEARGIGLMLALEFVAPDGSKQPDPRRNMLVLEEALKRGLLAYLGGYHGHVLRLIPPLTITQDQADEALSILDQSLSAAAK